MELMSDLSSQNWSASISCNSELFLATSSKAKLPLLNLDNLPSDDEDYGLNDETVLGDVRNHH
jgi:hypothetical protein